MDASHQTATRKYTLGTGIKPGKLPLLLLVQVFGLLFPLTFFPFGVWGGATYGFYWLCAVVQSAVIYYGRDLFDQSRTSYLRSLVSFFLVAMAVGTIGNVVYPHEILLYDGSCILFGEPTTIFFAIFT